MITRFLFAGGAAALMVSMSGLLAASSTPVPESLDIKAALQFALENNYAIRQAKERIRQQEGVELEVRAGNLPTVAVGAGYSLNDEAVSQSFPADDRTWSVNIQARQTIYSGGAVSASIQGARLAREAAVLELQGIVNDQLLLVRTRFYNVLLARERIAVQEENLKLLEEQLKTAQSRYSAGATSNFEVLRAEVALANGRPPLIQARNDFRIAVVELRQAVGYNNSESSEATKVPTFVGQLRSAVSDIPALVDALSTARVSRPEIQRLAKLNASVEERIKVARSGNKPVVQAFGRYDWVKGSPSAGWGDRADGWTVGLQSQWNVFDGRSTSGKVAQAKSLLHQSQLSIEETSLAIEVEVRRAHSSLQEAHELVASTGKVVEQAQEALRLATVRHTAGTATQLDVLTSQVALTEARLNQLRAYHSYNVAVAAFRKACGQVDNAQP